MSERVRRRKERERERKRKRKRGREREERKKEKEKKKKETVLLSQKRSLFSTQGLHFSLPKGRRATLRTFKFWFRVHFNIFCIFLFFDHFLCILIEFAFAFDFHLDLLMICLLLFLALHFCIFCDFCDFCWYFVQIF